MSQPRNKRIGYAKYVSKTRQNGVEKDRVYPVYAIASNQEFVVIRNSWNDLWYYDINDFVFIQNQEEQQWTSPETFSSTVYQ